MTVVSSNVRPQDGKPENKGDETINAPDTDAAVRQIDTYQRFLEICDFLYDAVGKTVTSSPCPSLDRVVSIDEILERTTGLLNVLNTFGAELLFETNEEGHLAFGQAVDALEIIAIIASSDENNPDRREHFKKIHEHTEKIKDAFRSQAHRFVFSESVAESIVEKDGSNSAAVRTDSNDWSADLPATKHDNPFVLIYQPENDGVLGSRTVQEWKNAMLDLINRDGFKKVLRLFLHIPVNHEGYVSLEIIDKGVEHSILIELDGKETVVVLYDSMKTLERRFLANEFSGEELLDGVLDALRHTTAAA